MECHQTLLGELYPERARSTPGQLGVSSGDCGSGKRGSNPPTALACNATDGSSRRSKRRPGRRDARPESAEHLHGRQSDPREQGPHDRDGREREQQSDETALGSIQAFCPEQLKDGPLRARVRRRSGRSSVVWDRDGRVHFLGRPDRDRARFRRPPQRSSVQPSCFSTNRGLSFTSAEIASTYTRCCGNSSATVQWRLEGCLSQ